MRSRIPWLVLVTVMLLALASAPASGSTPQDNTAVAAKRQGKCNTRSCFVRVERKRIRAIVAPYSGWLAKVRRCESGGNYRANTGNGFYGAYQFMVGTWQSVGGRGYPHQASPLEQDYRAVLLVKRSGRGQWPVCG